MSETAEYRLESEAGQALERRARDLLSPDEAERVVTALDVCEGVETDVDHNSDERVETVVVPPATLAVDTRYHRPAGPQAACHSLGDAVRIEREDAESLGFSPCQRAQCFGGDES